jgi:hypothetical protein
VFLTVHRQKAEPVAHSAAHLAAVPLYFETASPNCARNVQVSIGPSGYGDHVPNANPDRRDELALEAEPAARARSRGKEAPVQGHIHA